MANHTRVERPNLLIVMSDQHGPMFSGTYGHRLIQTPAMDRLSEEGVTFDNAYCNAPICVPSRASFMTGKYPFQIRSWDNNCALPSDTPTWPYLLRSLGYDVVLSGKMHLKPPDELNGFRTQLAVDLHARQVDARVRWKDVFDKPAPMEDFLEGAGAGITEEIRADESAEAAALSYLRDKDRKRNPWAICVGFLAPHSPLVVPEPYFSMYYPDNVDLPVIPPGHVDEISPQAKRLRDFLGRGGDLPEDMVRRARGGYYGLVTWMDAKIGRLLDTLDEEGLTDSTVVIYAADHGEMLGEHGMWAKLNFYEQSSRVPLQVRWPGRIRGGQRVPNPVSLIDVTATILDIAGLDEEQRRGFWDMEGDSLWPLLNGRTSGWKDEVFSEYEGPGTDRVLGMIRSGKWKLCYGHGDPPELELYDLEKDPGEFGNLADRPEYQEIRSGLFNRLLRGWDPDLVTAQVLRDQEIKAVLRSVSPPATDEIFNKFYSAP